MSVNESSIFGLVDLVNPDPPMIQLFGNIPWPSHFAELQIQMQIQSRHVSCEVEAAIHLGRRWLVNTSKNIGFILTQ